MNVKVSKYAGRRLSDASNAHLAGQITRQEYNRFRSEVQRLSVLDTATEKDVDDALERITRTKIKKSL